MRAELAIDTMLKLFFGWLDAHPSVYWTILAIPTGALVAIVVTALWRERTDKKPGRFDLLFIIASVAFLMAWRWPFLLESREFNPDESQLIAGAITLTHDPVFWRSVDGTTSGPLNFYALLPLHALGLPLDYFTARLTGLLLISITLIACYRFLRSLASPAASQLALLPLLIFYATTKDAFFLQYSSGDVSVALFAVSAYLMFGRSPSAVVGNWRLVLGAFTTGLLPWAKIQSAPLAAALIASVLWLIATDPLRSWRHRSSLGGRVLLAAALPTLFQISIVLMTGQLEAFVQRYLRQNFVYVDSGSSFVSALIGMWRFTSETYAFPAFLAESCLISLVMLCLRLCLPRRSGRLFLLSAVWVGTAAVCVLVPRRPFAHYLLLTLVPLALWSGTALGELWPAIRFRRSLGLVLLAIGGLAPLIVRLRQPIPGQFGNFADNWRCPYSLPGTILRSCRAPGDSLGVWGWRTDLYVDGGMPQATRDPHTVWSLENTPYQAYYRNRFLADLKHSRPAFFVDTVGRGAVFYRNRREFGHEIAPALADYIAHEYILLADVQPERIYLRADLRGDSRRDFSKTALQRILAKARTDAEVEEDSPDPESIIPATLGIWDLDGRNVHMLLPPAKMTWKLDGTEKEASVLFGFHPRAYLEGKSNGADFILELEAAGASPRILFQRHLDPARVPDDRKMLSARVPLPNNIAGARLVVRTEPGEYGDQAWDWVYLAALRYIRRPDQKFPGFGVARLQ